MNTTADEHASGADRALDAVARLLTTYGRFAFDTELAATALRAQCERWVQRIALGDDRRGGDQQDLTPLRDWHGLSLFFDQQRRNECDFVVRHLGGLRETALSLARCLSTNVGQDQKADAYLERQLQRLSRALERGSAHEIARAATIVVDSARETMTRRRSRDARHLAKLERRVRELREELAESCRQAGVDAATGFFTLTAFEQQLEQLAAIGMLLGERPWLVLMAVDDEVSGDGSGASARSSASSPSKSDTGAFDEVTRCVSRAFLRKEDFIACLAPGELAALLVDFRKDQLSAAIERLLAAVSRLGETSPNLSKVRISIGIARLEAGDEAAEWRARAQAALDEARAAGGNRYELVSD